MRNLCSYEGATTINKSMYLAYEPTNLPGTPTFGTFRKLLFMSNFIIRIVSLSSSPLF
jgi:hypothetical protein